MLQFLILPFIGLNSATTVQRQDPVQMLIGFYATIEPGLEETESSVPFRKINESSYTSLSLDEVTKAEVAEIDLDLNELTRNYDITPNLPAKKTFKVKAKIKSIVKVIPQPYLD